MARRQGVCGSGSDHLSGQCGRLMCCLAFEECMYKEALKKFPGYNTTVKTPSGKGMVLDNNIVTEKIKVRLEDGSIGVFSRSEVKY